MSFKKLGLSDPILRSLKELHHFEPSKIQKRAIPIVLSGNNLMAAAQTGTGKTGSFVLPIIEYLLDKPKPFKKHVHVLILLQQENLLRKSERVSTHMENLLLQHLLPFLEALKFFHKNQS